MRSANHPTLPFFCIESPHGCDTFWLCVNVNGHKIADFVFFYLIFERFGLLKVIAFTVKLISTFLYNFLLVITIDK